MFVGTTKSSFGLTQPAHVLGVCATTHPLARLSPLGHTGKSTTGNWRMALELAHSMAVRVLSIPWMLHLVATTLSVVEMIKLSR